MFKVTPQPRCYLLAGVLYGLLPQTCPAGVPSPEELSNATYPFAEEGPVVLTNGLWEGEPFIEGGASFPSAGIAKGFYLTGDLNGDDEDEAAVLLWQSSGGTGVINHLAVADEQNGEVRILDITEIGDRVQVRSGRIERGQIVLDVVQLGENEAACCPTQLATRSWSFSGDRLVEGEPQITGTLSLETLEGSNWTLTHLKTGEALAPEAEVTLLFAEGRVSGKSACNRYSAGLDQGEGPRDLKFGLAMGTRMACQEPLMDLEQQYLDALSRVTGFSFQAGNLVLNWEKDGEWFAMHFAPLPQAEL